MSLLAVVPARANSVGLPGKALRTVGGVPMILRTLRALQQSGVAERIVVSTDWPELRRFCELRGFEAVEQKPPPTDETTLLPIARHLAKDLEWEGTVGIFQPTCPLLKPETIRRAVDHFEASGAEWQITAAADPHIHWRDGEPLTERVNRQELGGVMRESGAVQLMSATYAAKGEGERETFEIPEREALDVDGPDDLLLAESLVGLRHIHFVVATGHEVGTGHFHRSLHLARVLSHHTLSWHWIGEPTSAQVHQVPPSRYVSDAEVTIFDRLEVPLSELLAAKSRGKVVVLEDEGADSGKLADLRVNEMLDPADLRYAVLREEFCCLGEREHEADAYRVLVTFGGTDPAGLAERFSTELSEFEVRVVEPWQNASMAEAMRWADVVLTGQGRTVLEAAACSTPCVSVAANEREARHIRIPGVTYLGLHSTVAPDQARHTVAATLDSVALRREMAQTARANFDDRGAERLARAIEGLTL